MIKGSPIDDSLVSEWFQSLESVRNGVYSFTCSWKVVFSTNL